jgi:hypothetical protein
MPAAALAGDAAGYSVVDSPAGLALVRRPACSLCLWPRTPEPALAALLDELDPALIGRVRIEAPLRGLAEALTEALPERRLQPLREDALSCAALLAQIAGAGAVRLRLECIADDACRRFHADNVALRLLCTYLGPGTEWLPDPAAPDRLRRMPPLAVALLKGRGWGDGGAACVHRSPPIAGLGVRRLLLAVDPLPLMDG